MENYATAVLALKQFMNCHQRNAEPEAYISNVRSAFKDLVAFFLPFVSLHTFNNNAPGLTREEKSKYVLQRLAAVGDGNCNRPTKGSDNICNDKTNGSDGDFDGNGVYGGSYGCG